MTIQDLYKQAVEQRSTVPLQELDILLSHVIKKPKEFIYGYPQQRLTASQHRRVQQLLKRREHGEPIAYLTGHKEFYGLDFLVTPAVLIPRPDTETLIEAVLTTRPPKKNKQETILDVGTGSGNIAITLKHYLPDYTVLASDVSKAALTVAKRNAKHLQASVQFFQSDVLKQIPQSYHHTIDLITFNAPYLTKQEAGKKNLHYEPLVALTPLGSPTSLIEQLLQQADDYLKPHGQIFFEMGWRQAKQVTKLVHHYFPTAHCTTLKDLGGFDRVVAVQF